MKALVYAWLAVASLIVVAGITCNISAPPPVVADEDDVFRPGIGEQSVMSAGTMISFGIGDMFIMGNDGYGTAGIDFGDTSGSIQDWAKHDVVIFNWYMLVSEEDGYANIVDSLRFYNPDIIVLGFDNTFTFLNEPYSDWYQAKRRDLFDYRAKGASGQDSIVRGGGKVMVDMLEPLAYRQYAKMIDSSLANSPLDNDRPGVGIMMDILNLHYGNTDDVDYDENATAIYYDSPEQIATYNALFAFIDTLRNRAGDEFVIVGNSRYGMWDNSLASRLDGLMFISAPNRWSDIPHADRNFWYRYGMGGAYGVNDDYVTGTYGPAWLTAPLLYSIPHGLDSLGVDAGKYGPFLLVEQFGLNYVDGANAYRGPYHLEPLSMLWDGVYTIWTADKNYSVSIGQGTDGQTFFHPDHWFINARGLTSDITLLGGDVEPTRHNDGERWFRNFDDGMVLIETRHEVGYDTTAVRALVVDDATGLRDYVTRDTVRVLMTTLDTMDDSLSYDATGRFRNRVWTKGDDTQMKNGYIDPARPDTSMHNTAVDRLEIQTTLFSGFMEIPIYYFGTDSLPDFAGSTVLSATLYWKNNDTGRVFDEGDTAFAVQVTVEAANVFAYQVINAPDHPCTENERLHHSGTAWTGGNPSTWDDAYTEITSKASERTIYAGPGVYGNTNFQEVDLRQAYQNYADGDPNYGIWIIGRTATANEMLLPISLTNDTQAKRPRFTITYVKSDIIPLMAADADTVRHYNQLRGHFANYYQSVTTDGQATGTYDLDFDGDPDGTTDVISSANLDSLAMNSVVSIPAWDLFGNGTEGHSARFTDLVTEMRDRNSGVRVIAYCQHWTFREKWHNDDEGDFRKTLVDTMLTYVAVKANGDTLWSYQAEGRNVKINLTKQGAVEAYAKVFKQFIEASDNDQRAHIGLMIDHRFLPIGIWEIGGGEASRDSIDLDEDGDTYDIDDRWDGYEPPGYSFDDEADAFAAVHERITQALRDSIPGLFVAWNGDDAYGTDDTDFMAQIDGVWLEMGPLFYDSTDPVEWGQKFYKMIFATGDLGQWNISYLGNYLQTESAAAALRGEPIIYLGGSRFGAYIYDSQRIDHYLEIVALMRDDLCYMTYRPGVGVKSRHSQPPLTPYLQERLGRPTAAMVFNPTAHTLSRTFENGAAWFHVNSDEDAMDDCAEYLVTIDGATVREYP